MKHHSRHPGEGHPDNPDASPSARAEARSSEHLAVTLVSFVKAPPVEQARGLLGFAIIRLGDTVEIGGIALRRRLDGTRFVSFPTRRDKSGRHHRIARLIGPESEKVAEAQILAELRVRGVLR